MSVPGSSDEVFAGVANKRLGMSATAMRDVMVEAGLRTQNIAKAERGRRLTN